jgi:hypothetical protein
MACELFGEARVEWPVSFREARAEWPVSFLARLAWNGP